VKAMHTHESANSNTERREKYRKQEKESSTTAVETLPFRLKIKKRI